MDNHITILNLPPYIGEVKQESTISNGITTLNLLPIGYKAKVKEIIEDDTRKRRFLDLGLIQNTEIKALQKSPAGDPIAYYIRGAVIALRSEEASKIIIEI